MKTARFGNYTRPQFRLAMDRLVQLLPVLEKADAPWAERVLFTHVGRWAKGSEPTLAKYRNAAARDAQWKIISTAGGAEPA